MGAGQSSLPNLSCCYFRSLRVASSAACSGCLFLWCQFHQFQPYTLQYISIIYLTFPPAYCCFWDSLFLHISAKFYQPHKQASGETFAVIRSPPPNSFNLSIFRKYSRQINRNVLELFYFPFRKWAASRFVACRPPCRHRSDCAASSGLDMRHLGRISMHDLVEFNFIKICDVHYHQVSRHWNNNFRPKVEFRARGGCANAWWSDLLWNARTYFSI